MQFEINKNLAKNNSVQPDLSCHDLTQEKDQAFHEINNFFTLNLEQKKSLETYVSSLLTENTKFNFIGKSTIDDIWHRHILDSAQLIKFIDNPQQKFADLGSGAGLPGMVMSILGLKEIHLIEKSFRKADFLRRNKNISKNKIYVHQAKLEELNQILFDCIMSRALAPLVKLLEYCQKFLSPEGYCLFLKGKNLPNEINLAKQQFRFDYELFESITAPDSRIIKINNIKKL